MTAGGGSFKVADAYADFHVDVDGPIGQMVDRIRAHGRDFDAGGRDAGGRFTTGYRQGLDGIGPATAGGASTAGKQAPKFTAAGEQLGESLGEGYERRALPRTEKATEKVAQRAQSKFAALKFAGAFGGLPLAAAGAAALAAGALAGAGAGVIGLAAVVQAQNPQIAASYNSLWQTVKAGAYDATAVMQGPLLQASDELGQSWTRLQPQVAAAAAGAADGVDELTEGVTRLAENAMPGLVRMAKASEGPMRGIGVLAEEVGTGFTEMSDGLIKGADGSKQSLYTLGNMARDAMGFVGNFVGSIAAQANPTLLEFDGVMEKAYATGMSLATDAFPTLQSAAGGFGTTVGGALDMANAFASGLGSWSIPLGNIGGQLYATNMLMGLMGTSIGGQVTGFKNLAAGVDAAGNKVGGLGEQIGKADGFLGKLKVGASALTSAGINPLGIALGVAAVAFSLFGQKAEEARQKQAAFDAGVKDLRSTLDENTGAITARTRAMTSDEAMTNKLGKSQKVATELAKEYGITQNELVHITTTGGAAMDAFESKMRGNAGAAMNAALSQGEWNTLTENGITSQEALTLALGGSVEGVGTLDDAVSKLTGSTDEHTQRLAAALTTIQESTQGQRDLVEWVRQQNAELAEAQRQMRATSDAASGMGGAFKLSAAASQIMADSLGKLGSDAVSAADEAKALMWVMNTLTGQNIELSDAQAKSGQAFRNADEAIKGFNSSAKATTADLVNSVGGINGFSAAGAKLNNVFQELSVTAGQEAAAAFGEVKAASGDMAAAVDAGTAPLQRARDKFIEAAQAAGLTGQQAASLADQMGLIPEVAMINFVAAGDNDVQNKLLAVRDAVVNMPSGTVNMKTEQIAGAEEELAALGYKVSALPNGEVRITAPGAPEVQQQITGIVDQVNTMPPGKTLTIDAPTAEVHTALLALGYTITTLPNGQVTITAATDPAKLQADALIGDINGRNGTVGIDGNPSAGLGQTNFLEGYINSTTGTVGINGNNGPAMGSLMQWKQKADGTWGWVNANANTGAANAAIDHAARPRTATITVTTINRFVIGSGAVGNSGSSNKPGLKDGGPIWSVAPGFADGGAPNGIQRYDNGGMLRGAGTSNSDKIPLWGSANEFLVEGDQYAANKDIVEAINYGKGRIDVRQFIDTPVQRGGATQPQMAVAAGGSPITIPITINGFTGDTGELVNRVTDDTVWALKAVL